MSWDYQRSQDRITGFKASVPQVRVELFETEYLPRLRRLRESQGESAPAALVRGLRPGEAVLVETVQLYVNVINYDEMRLEAGQETPASHARALSFLHLHYAALDRATDGVGAQRVDFHGPRMHAVLNIERSGDRGAAQDAVQRALELARQTIEISEMVTRDIVRGRVAPVFRVGIDIGRCVAIDSGRADEREPLFIGGAANHAAKLAEGPTGGIYPSDAVRALFGLPQAGGLTLERLQPASLQEAATLGFERLPHASILEYKAGEVRASIRQHRDATIGMDGFIFHHHQPPLSTIKYRELSPSKSIRMPLVSIFADLDGYTAYVDTAMKTGQVADAVRDLHVIRSELNAVLQEDFDGRKVRFIGDCIHGLIAAGDATSVDQNRSVEKATACAGALRSSFDLCRNNLPSAANLGLAVGFELGETPISRIGIRGDRSVRVASSRATLGSEQAQAECLGTETMIGQAAFAKASLETRHLFGSDRKAEHLDFDTVILQSSAAEAALDDVSAPAVINRSHSLS